MYLCFLIQGYATACLALCQLGMYSQTERSDLALAQELPWVRQWESNDKKITHPKNVPLITISRKKWVRSERHE